MTKEIIAETDIVRESGYLYFTGTTPDGKITICRAKMVHGKKKEEQD